MSATVITHGCRMNLAQADALAALAGPGRTVINSCAVTNEAVRDARAAAKRALKAGAEVAITGCAVEAEPVRFADLPVRLVGNQSKLDARAWRDPPLQGEGDHAKHGGGVSRFGMETASWTPLRHRFAAPPPPPGEDWPSPLAATRRARAFVAVQDGCDHRCTFCVIAPARGPARSAPLRAVIETVRGLVSHGVNEVVLTGVDATSWGQDLPGRPPLGALVQALLARTAVKRLRLSSLDAAEADPALIEALADPRVMPHLHLSLQSGDDLILKRMKRRHARADALRLVERLKRARPDIALGADLIAGFPTESEAAHANSLALLDDADIVHAHVFAYSPRPRTPAARMPQLPAATVKARAASLRARAEARRAAWLNQWLGQPLEIVAEAGTGWSPHYARVAVPADTPRGALISVTPRAIANGALH